MTRSTKSSKHRGNRDYKQAGIVFATSEKSKWRLFSERWWTRPGLSETTCSSAESQLAIGFQRQIKLLDSLLPTQEWWMKRRCMLLQDLFSQISTVCNFQQEIDLTLIFSFLWPKSVWFATTAKAEWQFDPLLRMRKGQQSRLSLLRLVWSSSWRSGNLGNRPLPNPTEANATYTSSSPHSRH